MERRLRHVAIVAFFLIVTPICLFKIQSVDFGWHLKTDWRRFAAFFAMFMMAEYTEMFVISAVTSARCSAETPRTLARHLSVCSTRAGSFGRLPRNGSGCLSCSPRAAATRIATSITGRSGRRYSAR